MAVTRIQRNSDSSGQTVETNARGHTQAASKDGNSATSKTQFDNPVAKSELAKTSQAGTQADSVHGQSHTYKSEQATRQQLDVKPPGEESAQFKGDNYNPSSTITRSKETDTQQKEDRDDKVKRKKDRERDEEEADDESQGNRRRRPRQVGRKKGGSSVPENVGGVPAVAGGGVPAVQSAANDGRRVNIGVLKGAPVLEGQTQDMFQPSTSTQASAKAAQERSVRETISMYSLGAVGAAVFTAVAANADPNGENGMGANMQKTLLNQSIEAMADAPDILSMHYREIVREIIQGTMQAAKENDIQTQGAIKMLVTSLMAVSPHDDDPKMMAEALKVISSEIIYCKLNVGYS
ncbi:MAG: hypothetical protein ACAI44_02550, partial [Candidatus Sericytochromatia bacterium]